jgi:L-methionine (R)-S-oxide reductase
MMPETTRSSSDRAVLYADLQRSLVALLAGEHDLIANAANLSALVFQSLPDLNWAGWYFLHGDELVLGPFQGKPACVRIGMGRGVCGTAAQQRSSLLVPDVHAFPGHIACDTASRSELVVPAVRSDGTLLGVFDLDSPRLARFNLQDQQGIEAAVRALIAGTHCN